MSKTARYDPGYPEFINSLTLPQLRALASQAGVVGFMETTELKLLDTLMDSLEGYLIYEENYQ